MDKTVSFFNNCKKYVKYIVNYFNYFLAFVIFSFLMIVGCILLINKFENVESILCLATNIRSNNKLQTIQISDVLSVFPVFNGDNYEVLKESTVQKVEKVNSINKSDFFFDASAVDKVSNIITIDKNYKKKSTKNYDRIDMYGVKILDYSTKKIDFEKLMDQNINLTKKSDPILMYCTHTSESYANSELFKFKYSGNYRTKNEKYNMLSVASIVENTLTEKGLTVVLDKTGHDYLSYNNAYTSSSKMIEEKIKEYSRFGMVMDIHRDAVADLTFAPKTTVNGKSVAQIMILIGVGFEGYPNKYWEENLSLALNIAKLGEQMYPGLFRHIMIRDSRYNQQLSSGSMLIEIGATGNTLEEAYYSARCFSNIVAKLYK